MFLPWSIFAMDAFFLLLELLVALSFGAVLARVSRKFEGRAQSIRWIHQAGKWEMFTALRLSRRMKAKTALRGLLLTLFISVALFGILSGVKTLVKEALGEGNPSQELVSSRQHTEGIVWCILSGWSFYIPYGAGVEAELTKAITGTMGIPQAMSNKRYRPRVSGYGLVCDQFEIRAPNPRFTIIPNDGCAVITLGPTGLAADSNLSRLYTIQRSENRVKVVVPALASAETFKLMPNMISDVGLYLRVDHEGGTHMTSNYQTVALNASLAGVSSSPRLVLTKTLLENGGSVILTTTAIRFTAPSNEMFHSVATSIFGEKDEMVLGMLDTVNNSTLTTLPPNELEQLMVMEIKVSGSEVTALICIWSRQSIIEVPHIACAYTISNILITKPQLIDPNVSRRLVNMGLNPSWSNLTVTAVLSYLPRVSKNTLDFDIPKIISESAVAARYIASLGHNFVMDWEGSILHATFDTVEIVKGYEIPRWLFFSAAGLMVTCFIFWIATELLVDNRYRESLYMVFSKELVGHGGGAEPRLHRFDPKTRMFEVKRRMVVSTLSSRATGDVRAYDNPTLDGSQGPLS